MSANITHQRLAELVGGELTQGEPEGIVTGLNSISDAVAGEVTFLGNARYLADRGAALLMPQPTLTPQSLADVLRGMTRAKLLEMARAARAVGKPDAASKVADICMELAPA